MAEANNVDSQESVTEEDNTEQIKSKAREGLEDLDVEI
jgi:hypothetical protein